MYRLRRCRICNHMVNVHKKGTRYVIRNPCEHMDVEGKSFTERELKDLVKGGGL